MLDIFATIIITYLIVTLIGYTAHRAIHKKWMGIFYKSHMAHHVKLYPPSDYSSSTYRSAGKHSTSKFFVAIAIPVVISLILLGFYDILPLDLVITSLSEIIILGWFHDLFHDAFHVKNHWLNKVPFVKNIFSRWNNLHFTHHINMNKNFGIFVFHWDKLFNTFKR